jgi:multidrug efflux pump subunit AcrB
MVTRATVAATGWMITIIPKSFFPEQDTGLMPGTTEAAESISADGMAAVQQEVLQTVLKDPAVASAGAYIGAGGATSTENRGRRGFEFLRPLQVYSK